MKSVRGGALLEELSFLFLARRSERRARRKVSLYDWSPYGGLRLVLMTTKRRRA